MGTYFHQVQDTRPARYGSNDLVACRAVCTLLVSCLSLSVRTKNGFEAKFSWDEMRMADQKGSQNMCAVESKANTSTSQPQASFYRCCEWVREGY